MKKDKEIIRVKNILINKKGYYDPNIGKGTIRKGYKWLSDHLSTDKETIQEAVRLIRLEKRINGRNIIKNKSIENPIVHKSNQINKPGTYFITGCAHAPWHNRAMYDSIFNYISKEVKLSGVILAGDIVDLSSLSFHDRGNIALPGVTLEWEYKEANKFLDGIDSMYANSSVKDGEGIHYIYGNHEDRYSRLMNMSDTSKYGDALKSPSEGLKMSSRGYNVLPNWKSDHIKIGKYLEVNHGEFLNVHSAKKTIDTYRKSVMYFHTHRFQVYMEGLVAGWNMGSGADFNAPIFGYATRAMKNSWVNSSALVHLDEDGYYHVQPMVFINNKLIINGIEY